VIVKHKRWKENKSNNVTFID